MRSLIKLYQNALSKRPFLIQAIQTGALMATGDLISQIFIESKSFREANYMRTLKFSSIGFFVAGPALRMWYGVLDKHIRSNGKAVALKKVLIDQLVFAPVFLLFILVAVPAMNGMSWHNIENKVKANYFDVLKTNYTIWPWVQIINFSFVPLQYQVLLVQFVALFWNVYLSWKTNDPKSVRDEV